MFRENQKIGHYRLIKKLAKGGFGEVWLAEKESPLVTKKVAVKLPHDSQIDIETIRQEAMLWEQASGHPNVLPIIDADIYEGQVVIVSEYAEDGSLSDRIRKAGGKLSPEESARIAVGILNGLEYLHSRGIIHRDIKPANILMQGDTPRLADFGISRAMQTENVSTAIVGTYNYMSPESFEGVRNVKTDVWAVGVVLYQLLNGLPPYPQREPSEVMYAILMKDYAPLPEEIPLQLREIVYKALEKDQLPDQNQPRRYQSAAAMRDDLQQFLADSFETRKSVASSEAGKIRLPIRDTFSAEPPPSAENRRFPSKLSPLPALALLLAALGVIWGALYLFNRPPAETPTAVAESTTSVSPMPDAGETLAAQKLRESIAFSKQGAEYYRARQFDSAIAAYTKAVELNPIDFGSFNNRGMSYHNKRKFAEAISDYTKSIELNPSNAAGYNNRGAAYEDLKDYEKAAADFRRATEIDPNDVKSRENLARVSRKFR